MTTNTTPDHRIADAPHPAGATHVTTDSLEGLKARMVELVDELFRRGVGVEELCRWAGVSSLDELRSLVGNDAALR